MPKTTSSSLLTNHINHFFSLQIKQFATRFGGLTKEQQKRFDWARDFTHLFIESRTKRADDLNTPEIDEARRLELAFIGVRNHHFVVDCMDGRNMPAVELSHVPHVGGVMRTPGGDIVGFRPGTKAHEVMIDYHSFPVQRITQLFREKHGDQIHYSLVSHYGCAARGGVEESLGIVTDAGLRVDVARKMLIARGIKQLHEALEQDGEKNLATVLPQFYSYDPHDGTITMGLEIYADDRRIGKAGFTKEMLVKLHQEKKIVSTWDFLADSRIVAFLQKTVKAVDFRNAYPKSMLTNWQAITKLYKNGSGEVYQTIYKRLVQAYTQAGWKVGKNNYIYTHEISTAVLINKAKVMLKNLVTRWSIAENKKGHHTWPFDRHVEQAIILTEGGYGPFPKLDVFSLFSKSNPNMLIEDIYLAHGLIRKFRKDGGIVDALGRLDSLDFVEAPIVIFNKGILRNMSKEGWQVVEKIDLTPFINAIDWDNEEVLSWQQEDVQKHIEKELVKLSYAEGVMLTERLYGVFNRMRYMMRDHRMRGMLLNGNVIVINLLVDYDRRPRLLVPMVT